MKLTYINGDPVEVGDKALDFRGNRVVVEGMRPPHKPSSTGRVILRDQHGRVGEYFPGVINASWVEE